MKKTDEKYQAYIQILKEELVPAMGVRNRSHLLMQEQRQEKYWDVYRIKYW